MKFFFIFLSLINITFADLQHQPGEETFLEELFRERVLFISLGSACDPTTLLQNFDLRKAAFPFDWNVTLDGAKLTELLERDFSDFLNEEFLALIDFGNGIGLYHKYYHIEFVHDGVWSAERYAFDMDQMKSKYQRRIDRFRKLREYRGKVYFLRYAYPHDLAPRQYQGQEIKEITDEDSYKLCAALKSYFPHLNFTLLILNNFSGDHRVFLEKKLSNQLWKIRVGHILHTNNPIYRQFFYELAQLIF